MVGIILVDGFACQASSSGAGKMRAGTGVVEPSCPGE